jgi:hypothetical protein
MAGISAAFLSILFGTQQSMSGSPSGATFYFTFACVAVFAAIIMAIVLMVRDSDSGTEVTPLSVPPSPEGAHVTDPLITDEEVGALPDEAFYADLAAHVPGFKARQSGEPA